MGARWQVQRAKASVDRHSKRLRQFKGTTIETEDERAFRSRSLRPESSARTDLCYSTECAKDVVVCVLEWCCCARGVRCPGLT